MTTSKVNKAYKVQLNKFEKNGALVQLTNQILKLEYLNQIPESVLTFTDGKLL